jgi:hypothetical protein
MVDGKNVLVGDIDKFKHDRLLLLSTAVIQRWFPVCMAVQ